MVKKNIEPYVLFSPRNKDFLSFRAFLFFSLWWKKYQQKIVKCRRQWKVFFSRFSFISFNKDFPLIFTDAILINFHRRENL